ncbi:MAG: thioredoxin domain-containing protein [Thermoanaerobaculia bacterium]
MSSTDTPTDTQSRTTLWKALALLAAVALAIWVLVDRPATADDPAVEPPAAGKNQVVATLGEEAITLAELEEHVAPQLMKVAQERQTALEQGLEALVRQRLLDKEAAERGVEVQELIQSEVHSKVESPTDTDVDAFYEENRARINQPKEQVVGQIREYLLQEKRQEATVAFFDSLRDKYGVEELLEPLRLPVETAGFPAQGPENAPVTVVEFSDFQCPFCARVLPTVDQVRETYGENVRIVFRQFPLRSIHPQAQKAAEASLCAQDQGKFWELHDAMFADQSKLAVADLKATAASIELKAEAFNECLDSGEYADEVQADLDAGAALGVSGTPALFVNGRPLPGGAVPFEQVADFIDEELERAGGSPAPKDS